jgi:hypothetical protein
MAAEYSWSQRDGDWVVRGWDVPQDVLDKLGQFTPVEVTVKTRAGKVAKVTVGAIHSIDRRVTFLVPAKPAVAEDEKVDPDVQPGVYENSDGIYLVKQNREKTGLYAKRLVESAVRLSDTEAEAEYDFEYESGAIFRIKADDRMPLDRAKELVIRYSRCIACGAHLRRKESVERGIGPVCIKSFAPPLDPKARQFTDLGKVA